VSVVLDFIPKKSNKPPLPTRICELFGIEYPIIQTGMGWVAGARLTAATSQAGGLGILASATMDLEQLKTAIREALPGLDFVIGWESGWNPLLATPLRAPER